MSSFKKMLFPVYKELIDSVSSDQINQIMKKMLKSNPTLVLMGKDFTGMPEIQNVKNYFAQNI